MAHAVDWNIRKDRWEDRVRRYGTRAVFNWAHPESELDAVSEKQQQAILPLFGEQLRGDERTVLDFGCGWGRWSTVLADIVRGRCIAVDPTAPLLEIARRQFDSDSVVFAILKDGRVPLTDASVDVVWCCLSLSTILEDEMLDATALELNRVLKPGGLLFVVDHTLGKDGKPVFVEFSRSRSVEEYRARLAPIASLSVLGHYFDLGERIEVMAGRKP